ncbi:MAG: M48 family metallopeptidase [Deferrisomatales bacterium]
MARDVVRWGRVEIPYTVQRTKRKSLAISVHPDLAVTVRAPEDTPPEAIRERVRQRGAWIQKAWREFELYLPKQPPRRYVSGETHRYLGRQYRLRTEQGEEESVKCLRGYLRVTTRGEPSPEKTRRLLEEWYREHARRVFRERLEACSQRASVEGIQQPPLAIRKMPTRWGSCSNAGRINLNLELIKASKDCIDYVITHELCHLKERHHGPRFWRLMAKLMPDYEARREKLNRFADV